MGASPLTKVTNTIKAKQASDAATAAQNIFNINQAKTPVEGDAINKKLRNIGNLRLGIGSTLTGAGLQPAAPLKNKLGA